MNTPVKFEIAKLIKDKGIIFNCDGCYSEHDTTRAYPKEFIREGEVIEAPTISDVVMWLYDKHDIWVGVDTHEFKKWCYNIKRIKPIDNLSKINEIGELGLEDFSSPTEAYLASIDYVLKNLI